IRWFGIQTIVDERGCERQYRPLDPSALHARSLCCKVEKGGVERQRAAADHEFDKIAFAAADFNSKRLFFLDEAQVLLRYEVAMDVRDHSLCFASLHLKTEIRGFEPRVLQKPGAGIFKNNASVFQDITAVSGLQDVLDILLDQQ